MFCDPDLSTFLDRSALPAQSERRQRPEALSRPHALRPLAGLSDESRARRDLCHAAGAAVLRLGDRRRTRLVP